MATPSWTLTYNTKNIFICQSSQKEVEDGVCRKSDGFALIREVKKMVPTATVPNNIMELRSKKVRYHGKCKIGKEEVEKIILNHLPELGFSL